MITPLVTVQAGNKRRIPSADWPSSLTCSATEPYCRRLANDIFLERRNRLGCVQSRENLRLTCNFRAVIPFSPTEHVNRRPTVCLYADHIDRCTAFILHLFETICRERGRSYRASRDRAQIIETPRHRSSREMRSVPVIDRFGDTVPLGDMYMAYMCNELPHGHGPREDDHLHRKRNLGGSRSRRRACHRPQRDRRSRNLYGRNNISIALA